MAKIKKGTRALVTSPVIDAHIHGVRGLRVMMDRDLAALYGVPTKSLNLAVKRNSERFPADFMFQLNREEVANLRFQFETSSPSHGGRRSMPYVFTQEGVAMLSGILRSPRAVAVNIEIMRAFVRLRRLVLSVDELAGKVAALEKKYDGQFGLVFDAIKELMAPSSDDPDEDGTIGFLGAPKKAKPATP
jgi:hypothetical protein